MFTCKFCLKQNIDFSSHTCPQKTIAIENGELNSRGRKTYYSRIERINRKKIKQDRLSMLGKFHDFLKNKNQGKKTKRRKKKLITEIKNLKGRQI